MLIHGQHVAQAAVQHAGLIDGGTAACLKNQLYGFGAFPDDVSIGGDEARLLNRRRFAFFKQNRSQITDYVE